MARTNTTIISYLNGIRSSSGSTAGSLKLVYIFTALKSVNMIHVLVIIRSLFEIIKPSSKKKSSRTKKSKPMKR